MLVPEKAVGALRGGSVMGSGGAGESRNICGGVLAFRGRALGAVGSGERWGMWGCV